MKVETKVLDEVVVVGYGVQKKVNLTGSVTSINFADQTEGRPIMSVSSALSGLAAGMNVTQASGQPGSDGATIASAVTVRSIPTPHWSWWTVSNGAWTM